MKRRAARETAFRLTYEMIMTGQYNPDTEDELLSDADADSKNYVDSVVRGVSEHLDELKKLIGEYSHGYDLDRIYKTDMAMLLVACYEILYTETPAAVVVNEAVEIVKAYSDTQSYSFVNGILASVISGGARG